MKNICLIAVIIIFVKFGKALEQKPFECFVCNKEPHEDDSQACIERLEACPPNVTSCSSVAFRSSDGKMRTRKFCTSPGIPIYQYLMLFPGSSLCQNIETTSATDPPPQPIKTTGRNGKPIIALPPSPPTPEASTLLCVCTKPRCNGGNYREVMEKTMMHNLEAPGEKIVKKHDLFVGRRENPPVIRFFK